MTNRTTQAKPREDHWLGEPVVDHKGTYDQVEELIPVFGRRTFALYTGGLFAFGENPYYDEVLLLDESGQPRIPVGIVSKTYKLIQHRDIFKTTISALHEAAVPLNKVTVFLTMSQFCSRMALRFVFPDEFGLEPGDGHPLRLRLECLNSVDGSTRLIYLMSWYRLVCSNGLIARVNAIDEAIVHTEKAEIPDIRVLIRDSIASIPTEREHFALALRTRVDVHRLRRWVDGELKKKWGALAAARTYFICQTGFDGVFEDPFDKRPPSEKPMTRTEQVPGAVPGRHSSYSISQALAWIARQRFDVQEQTEYMREIPQLIDALERT
jgi:hypothetical protein